MVVISPIKIVPGAQQVIIDFPSFHEWLDILQASGTEPLGSAIASLKPTDPTARMDRGEPLADFLTHCQTLARAGMPERAATMDRLASDLVGELPQGVTI